MPKNLQTRLRLLDAEIQKLAARNDGHARLDATGKDSVSQLAQSINRLLGRRQTRDSKLPGAADLFQQTFWILDGKGRRVTYLNGPGNLSSDPKVWVTSAFAEDRDVVKSMITKQRQGEAGQCEFRIAGPDGGVRWLWCRYIPLPGRGGRVSKTVGLFEEITDQKEAEQILTASHLELDNVIEMRQSQKLQTIGELMGGIAHEINTPVQFVGDNLRFVREALPRLEAWLKSAGDSNPDLVFLRDELPNALQHAQEGVDRVAKIAKTMKEYSREQKDQGRKAADLNLAVESTLLMARNAVKYVADVETSFGVLPLVNCHLGDIQQVLLELIVRAAEVIGENHAKTKKRGLIRVETVSAGDWVTISVGDSGDPLTHAETQQIFEQATAEREKGKGLALAHAIITEQHGGMLTVASENGKGNTFSIRLPVLGKEKLSRFSAGAS